jgi:integrase
LDTLDPPGEVKSTLVNIKHGEPDPSMERLIESWKSPEARGEYAADFIFQSLRKIPNLSPQEREARGQYLNKLGVPSLLREFYGMSEAATDLIPRNILAKPFWWKFLQGFKGSTLFGIVATAAFTGARRNEVLALQWTDLDVENKTLRIERAIEETRQHGLVLKGPKTERGKRTIAIDDDLIALLLVEREKHLRVVAGVSDTSSVDLALVKLPKGALMFPNPPTRGESFSFTRFRNPRNTTKEFVRKATALGFPGLRLHDLRGSHETALLDAGVPVHVVAARCGHDPAVMLRSYAKRTRKADLSAADAIAALTKGALT